MMVPPERGVILPATSKLFCWSTPVTFALSAADVLAGDGMLVSLSDFKKRIAIADDDRDLDPYLAALLAQSMGFIHELSGWPTRTGKFAVSQIFDYVVVVAAEGWVHLGSPISTVDEIAVKTPLGETVQRLTAQSLNISPSLGASASGKLMLTALSGEELIVENTVSWDQWVGTVPSDSALADIAYRSAATLFAYRESQRMGYDMARRAVHAELAHVELRRGGYL